MAYVGNEPTSNFASVTKDSFSGDGSTTAFTLSKAATTNGVAVFVENVRQEPTTAYAVSGTTLTFTAAPVSASGNNIYVLHHNAPASTAIHSAAQPLTATSGTFTGDVSIDGGSFVFNESSADKDFRVESNDNANMLFVDGGNNRIGIGTASADGGVHIKGVSDHGRRILESGGTSGSNNGTFMQFHNHGGTEIAQIAVDEGSSNEGQMLFKTGGTDESMRITHDHKVGIGATAPAEALEVKTSSSPAIQLNQGGDYQGIIRLAGNDLEIRSSSGTIEFFNGAADGDSSTERMRINTSGYARFSNSGSYVGVDATNYEFTTSTNTWIQVLTNSHASAPWGTYMDYSNDDPDGSGNLFFLADDSSASRIKISSDGDVLNHDGTYTSISDERVKQDIRDTNSQWDDIKALKIKNFRRKDDVRQYGDEAWEQIGLIAQEVEKVCPKLIKTYDPDIHDIASSSDFGTVEDDLDRAATYYEEGDTIPDGKKVGDAKTYRKKVKEVKEKVKAVKYSILHMKAVKALQEAMTRIETLEAKVKTLEDA